MPPRNKASDRKSKGTKPTLVKGGNRKFGNSLTAGLQLEYAFRRLYPLSEADFKVLHRLIREVVARYRRRYRWFFVSIQIKVLGGLYQVRFVPVADEDATWEKQWISTKVNEPPNLAQTLEDVRYLLTNTLEFQLQGRPCWILRVRVVFLNNHHKYGTAKEHS